MQPFSYTHNALTDNNQCSKIIDNDKWQTLILSNVLKNTTQVLYINPIYPLR